MKKKRLKNKEKRYECLFDKNQEDPSEGENPL